MVTIQTLDRIDGVERGEWDELCAGRPFADHRWLSMAEQVLVGHRPRYVLLRHGGRLEAAAVCSIERQFQNRFLQRHAGRLLHHLPHLRCAVPISLEPGILVRPGCDERERIPALLGALADLAARERASFMRMIYLSSHDEAWPLVRAGGYRRMALWTDTYLPISWPSFESYLAGLSRSKRQAIGRIERRARREGVAVGVVSPSAEVSPTLRTLVSNVLRRHGAQDVYPPDLFARAASALGDDFVLLGAQRAGQPVGCAALLRSGGEVTAKWLGLDYSRTWDTATYHRLVLECVAQAIALGASRLRTGATAHETKRHFGVTSEERSAAIVLRNRPLTWLAGLALGASDGRLPVVSERGGRETRKAA